MRNEERAQNIVKVPQANVKLIPEKAFNQQLGFQEEKQHEKFYKIF